MFGIPEKRSNFFSTVPYKTTPVGWGTTRTSGPKQSMSGAGVEESIPETSLGIKIIEGNGQTLAGAGKFNPTENLKNVIIKEVSESEIPLTRERFGNVMTGKFMPLFINRMKRVGIHPSCQYGGRLKKAFSRQIRRCFTGGARKLAGQGVGAVLATAASALPTILPIAERAAVAIWNFFKKIFRKKKKTGQGLRLSGRGTPMRRGMPTKIVKLIAEDVRKFIRAMTKRRLEEMSGRGVGSFLKDAFKKVTTFVKKIFKKGEKVVKAIKPIVKVLPKPIRKKIKKVTRTVKKISRPTKELIDIAREFV